MMYGLNIAASGALTSMYRQDVLSNNLANMDVVGFKPDLAETRQRDPARVEDHLLSLPSNRMLERLGAGALMAPNRVSLGQGDLDTTHNPLDVAIKGQGFFVVASGSGSDTERVRLTRDGRLSLDGRGRLVLAASGLPVLDTADKPIVLDPTATRDLVIDSEGNVSQHGRRVAQIQVTNVPDPAALRKAGDGLLTASAAAIASRRPAAGAELAQGTVERSAVDPIKTMLGITDAGNSVANNARMIQLFDDLMNRAINTFGRVA